jgi:hypothetical protein
MRSYLNSVDVGFSRVSSVDGTNSAFRDTRSALQWKGSIVEAMDLRVRPSNLKYRAVFAVCQFHPRGFQMRIISTGLLLIVVSTPVAAQTNESLLQSRNEFLQRQQAFAEELNALADQLERQGLTNAANEVREAVPDEEAPRLQFQSLPRERLKRLPPAGTPEGAWQHRLRFLKHKEADELYAYSQAVMKENHVSLAYRIVREVARLNPDHEAARNLLGYLSHEGEWLTPFEADKQRKREIWDDRFGWIPEQELPRYEQGLRKYNGRWIPAEHEAELRRDFRNAWEIRTEHWLVKTNHSLERGVEIAEKLEDYYSFFISEFPGLFNTRAQMKKLFAVGANARPRMNQNPFVVHYYKSKDEYVIHLQRQIPIIGSTNGIYLQDSETSYFFHRPGDSDDSTLYHEATHQILWENRPSKREIAESNHFWVIEGFACYMESYRNDDGVISLGDPYFIRFDNARARLIADRFYLPLASMVELGMKQYQAQEALPLLYSQASGMVHFFLHADKGRYRDSFLEYLAGIYSSRQKNGRDIPSLEKLTGLSFHELDKEYILYMKRQAEEIVDSEQQTGEPREP